jgi:hypothetical protein
MKMKSTSLKDICIFLCELLLAILFVYTSIIKFKNFADWSTKYNALDIVHDFHLELGLYLIPFLEVFIVFSFIFQIQKQLASWICLLLLSIFTIYIWQESLCPCGGIFGQIMLDSQLWISVSFLSVAIVLNVLQVQNHHPHHQLKNNK